MEKTIQHGNAVIKVYRPTITDEERKRRERQISIALQQLGQTISKTGGKENE